MKTIKPISVALNSLYTIMVGLLLLDELTPFDIKSQSLKTFIYEGLLFATPVVLIFNAIVLKKRSQKLAGLALPILMLVLILIFGPINLLWASGAWQTQTVFYKNRNSSFQKVEFQMQDVGALGYNKRTVKVFYLTPFFMITSAVPNGIEKDPAWEYANEDVNELQLKFP
jgi:hypothetical protein